MTQGKIYSPGNDGAHLVAPLLARIDQLVAQIAARDARIDELLAQVKALNARITELEAKRGGPPKTPDNSSLPPSRGQKANAEPPAVKPRRKGRSPPDTIFYNGKIITVDSGFTIQQAFAVRGDLYVAVGSNAAIQALAR